MIPDRYKEDIELSPEQLDGKYNPDGEGEHPWFTREDWRNDVADEVTISGYWAWVHHKLTEEP